ncbi:uncharacterized protein LOC117639401 [Thrips palmi]|uniref:Uncharacterized protein LOC117639401 n=1 Tax=Thrips palmi TaxID=161013 RepID=A0A6P8ZGY3_THRPL|nr:uncharacterized protein LOC117639401 [Thrips palmi]
MYRLKGKLVSAKQYNAYLSRVEILKKGRVLQPQPDSPTTPTTPTPEPSEPARAGSRRSLSPATDENSTPKVVVLQTEEVNVDHKDCGRGRRIVEIFVLAKHLWCCSCKECLSLEYIERETRCGLGSLFYIRCHKCAIINVVPTGKRHKDALGRDTLFDVNFKAALGVTSSGCCYAHLDKLLANMNMPNMAFDTFKKYERTSGKGIEKIARESCEEAAKEERALTVQNKTSIEKILPEHLQQDFLLPVTPSRGVDSTPDCESSDSFPATFDQVVRIMVSYDMGWSKRGAGRNYDSLNGYGAIIGNLSGKVLDFHQCNRKCQFCDMGHDPSSHDCRLNYFGSAKGMEAHTAEKLVTKSSILKSQNLQVGILIGDDDSSSIASCRAASSHEIVKQSDMNHTSKGVKNTLYGIEKSFDEINGDAILYLHRCFTYALSQNRGNCGAMAVALRAIPYHAFNDHTICGDWCGYKKDPENYDHRIVPGGFTDPALQEKLIDIFNKLANNASKFSAAASSNSNESLNSMMARKCSKMTCYSRSESADFRFGAVVGKKNLGEVYTQKVNLDSDRSPGSPFHSKFITRTDQLTSKKRKLYGDPGFKAKRIKRSKARAALKNRKEKGEGTTYQPQMNLLMEDGIGVLPTIDDEDIDDVEELSAQGDIILFDLETGGLYADSDILQIGAKRNNDTFSVYIKPTKPINKRTSLSNGLTTESGDLFKNGICVQTVPLQAAIEQFLKFLSKSKNVYLCAHKLSFDGPRIVEAFRKCNLIDTFSTLVKGMVDSLPVIKKHRPDEKSNSLQTLCADLNIDSSDAHDALADVTILNTVLVKLKISSTELIENSTDIQILIPRYYEQKEANSRLKDLKPLFGVVSENMRKKLAAANVSLQSLRDAYNASGETGISELLGNTTEDGKPLVTRHKPVFVQLANWLGQRNINNSNSDSNKNNSDSNSDSNKNISTNNVVETVQSPSEMDEPDLVREYLEDGEELSFFQL